MARCEAVGAGDESGCWDLQLARGCAPRQTDDVTRAVASRDARVEIILIGCVFASGSFAPDAERFVFVDRAAGVASAAVGVRCGQRAPFIPTVVSLLCKTWGAPNRADYQCGKKGCLDR